MKQTSNPWAKLFLLMLITASAVVLFTVTALAKSPSSALASDDSVHATPVPTAAPVAIFISTSHSATIDENDQDFHFRRNDIVLYVPGTGTFESYLVGNDIGLSGVNLQDFEVLPDGDVLFVIDRKKTLHNPAGSPVSSIAVTPRDVIRYDRDTGRFSIELVGMTIGLHNSSGNLDALAIAANGHLVISTEGSATINGVGKVHDRDLVEVIGTNGVLYFNGTEVGLKSSSEDVSSAWIDTASADMNLYLVTKGNFSVTKDNTLHGKKNDIFGCSPTSQNPIASCFFFEFFKGKPTGLDNQIDGISILFTGPIPTSVVSAAAQSGLSSVDDDSIDAETFTDAMSAGDPEITAEDFVDVSSRMYLPMIAAH